MIKLKRSLLIASCQIRIVLTSVPQGSILGPLLSLLFVNDMFFAPKICYLNMFADNSTLHTHGDSAEELTSKLHEDLRYINNWSIQNRMCINLVESNKSENEPSTNQIS